MTRIRIDYGWPDQRPDAVTDSLGSENVNCQHHRYTSNRLPHVAAI